MEALALVGGVFALIGLLVWALVRASASKAKEGKDADTARERARVAEAFGQPNRAEDVQRLRERWERRRARRNAGVPGDQRVRVVPTVVPGAFGGDPTASSGPAGGSDGDPDEAS